VNVSANPMPVPSSASFKLCLNTNFMTFPGLAPIAILRPNSFVLSRTK
jgi:hypothetical protein